MKTLLPLFIIMISLKGFGQDPELFKTWYLTDWFTDPGGNPHVIDIEPRISPTLILEESLSFSGEAACNTFNGTLSYDSSNSWFEVLTFNKTDNTCEHDSHTLFETTYFSFFEEVQSFQAWVENQSDGSQTMHTLAPSYPVPNFSNMPLSITENNFEKITLYPNPVLEKLWISNNNYQIDQIKVISISGKTLLEQLSVNNSIDVSSLPQGIYFLEISTGKEISVLRFIKK